MMDDKRLDRNDEVVREMLRSAFGSPEPATNWPSADVVYAYLDGTATDAQRSQVALALRRSAEFRKHVVELGQMVESLSNPEVKAAFEAAREERLPHWLVERLKSERPEPLPRESWLAAAWKRFIDLLNGSWLRMGLAVGAAAAVTLVGVYTFRQAVAPQSIELARSGDIVNPSDLARSDTEPVGLPVDDRDAALDALGDRVTFTSGELKTIPPALRDTAQVSGGTRSVVVSLRDASGSKLAESTFRIPTDAKEVQAWVMLLGTRELQKVPISSNRVDIRLPADVVEPSGVLTLTYQLDGQFVSTAAESF